jgi:hypothetical protein
VLGISGHAAAASALPPQAAAHFAIADFDGDSRPDLASVGVGQTNARSTRYWIAFHLSSGAGQTVGITAPTGGLQLASRDVNGDTFPDVIVTTAWTNTPVAILLNDGFGNFTTSDVTDYPSAFIRSDASWSIASDEIRDVAAILLSRSIPGGRATNRGMLLPAIISALRAPLPDSPSPAASASPFIGRAPPCPPPR